MGAWGTGPFDNDDAADFSAELDEADPTDRANLIRSALQAAVDTDDYLDVDTGGRAVAAAALVAASRPGGTPIEVSYGPEFLALDQPLDLPDDLVELARQALDRVRAEDSEWRELWEDSTESDDALANLRTLQESLV
ncbi:MAG TPA: DUF4259 domain-containing protein [Micromonosporaceae bacterium]|nr:DUF4259 domain-containing protein [Micromonosporaceae bacterium]